MDVEEFFGDRAESKQIFDQVRTAANTLGPIELRVTKSQVAFVRRKPFAWVWVPAMYLHRQSAPLVLAFSFRERRPWPRWKEIYQAAPGRFTHHLELWSPHEVGEEVRTWMHAAWEAEGSPAVRKHDHSEQV